MIRQISPSDGPAAKARLHRGDIIVGFDGTPIEDTDHLVRVIGATPVGTEAEIVYLRGGKKRSTTTTLAAREVSPVLVGSGRSLVDEPRISRWRGAWLAEPTDAVLAEFGLPRQRAGLVIIAVDPDSDAEKAGLKPQQIILELNRQPVHTIEEFLAADKKAAPAVTLEISSEGTTKTVHMPVPDRSL